MLSGQLSQQELDSFLAGTRSIARLKHPNILRILEFGMEDRTPFLVTEYTSDNSLRQLYPPGSQIPPDKIASYVRQVAAALHYIHAQGLIHGGVKPENMVLGSQGRVQLGNFGTTIDVVGPTRSLQNEEERELGYEAPELLLGRASPASGQYALGMVVYEWLSGDLPSHENIFYFYVNKELIMQAQDSTLQSGAVSMYIVNSSDAATEAVFRNAMLWRL